MMTDNQQEMDALIVRLFNQLDEQQRIIDRLLTLLTELRAMAMGGEMTDKELDDILGRGLGDPDMWGYPGEECYV